MISIGTIGLIKAVNTFCPERNIKLATYASRCIENEILMHIRKVSNQKTEVSLDEPINMDYDGNELLLSDILGTEEDMILKPMEDDVDLCVLREAVRGLPGREREIVFMRFGLEGAVRRRILAALLAGIMVFSQTGTAFAAENAAAADTVVEAARIDGASMWQIFWNIVMPCVKPGWLTLMLLSVQSLWSLGSTTYIFSDDLKTLAYALGQIASAGIARAGVGSAVGVVMMSVPIMVFIFSQSNIIETMSTSGLKE